jgi:hypothetical protein
MFYWNKAPRLAVVIPRSAAELGLSNPYPGLAESWDKQERQWGWPVPALSALPDVSAALDLALPFHPESGPMTSP